MFYAIDGIFEINADVHLKLLFAKEISLTMKHAFSDGHVNCTYGLKTTSPWSCEIDTQFDRQAQRASKSTEN